MTSKELIETLKLLDPNGTTQVIAPDIVDGNLYTVDDISVGKYLMNISGNGWVHARDYGVAELVIVIG